MSRDTLFSNRAAARIGRAAGRIAGAMRRLGPESAAKLVQLVRMERPRRHPLRRSRLQIFTLPRLPAIVRRQRHFRTSPSVIVHVIVLTLGRPVLDRTAGQGSGMRHCELVVAGAAVRVDLPEVVALGPSIPDLLPVAAGAR